MAKGRRGHPECDGQHLQHRQRTAAEHRVLHVQGDRFRGHGHEPAGGIEYQRCAVWFVAGIGRELEVGGRWE